MSRRQGGLSFSDNRKEIKQDVKIQSIYESKQSKRENGTYAPTVTMTDENGKPLTWEFRHITSKENEDLRDSCTFLRYLLRENRISSDPN